MCILIATDCLPHQRLLHDLVDRLPRALRLRLRLRRWGCLLRLRCSGRQSVRCAAVRGRSEGRKSLNLLGSRDGLGGLGLVLGQGGVRQTRRGGDVDWQ
jgi:transposase